MALASLASLRGRLDPSVWFAPSGSWGRRLADVWTDQSSAQTVGLAYLSGLAEPPPVQAWIDEMRADMPLRLRLTPRPARHRLRTYLQDRVRQDFVAKRTLFVDGWLLAQTEVRLCALAAMYRA